MAAERAGRGGWSAASNALVSFIVATGVFTSVRPIREFREMPITSVVTVSETDTET